MKKTFSFFKRLSSFFSKTPRTQTALIDIIRDAQSQDILDVNALSMIEGVLHVSQMRVSDVMIPRSQMIVIEKDASFEEILPIIVDSSHSRFPVVGENRSEVIGILLAKDLLRWVSERGNQDNFPMRRWLRPATIVPESKRLNILLNDFRLTRSHLAIVVDEYGSTTGLVTIEDVLEQIVGDIADEHDDLDDETSILQHDDGHWSIKALTSLEEFDETFKTSFSQEGVDTVGGLVLRAFGRLPAREESIEIEDFIFTVVRADNRRLHLLHMVQKPKEIT